MVLVSISPRGWRLYYYVYRGGAEHGLGIYISQVEIGSEAHVKGLKKGDQILKVICYSKQGQKLSMRT